MCDWCLCVELGFDWEYVYKNQDEEDQIKKKSDLERTIFDTDRVIEAEKLGEKLYELMLLNKEKEKAAAAMK